MPGGGSELALELEGFTYRELIVVLVAVVVMMMIMMMVVVVMRPFGSRNRVSFDVVGNAKIYI